MRHSIDWRALVTAVLASMLTVAFTVLFIGHVLSFRDYRALQRVCTRIYALASTPADTAQMRAAFPECGR